MPGKRCGFLKPGHVFVKHPDGLRGILRLEFY